MMAVMVCVHAATGARGRSGTDVLDEEVWGAVGVEVRPRRRTLVGVIMLEQVRVS